MSGPEAQKEVLELAEEAWLVLGDARKHLLDAQIAGGGIACAAALRRAREEAELALTLLGSALAGLETRGDPARSRSPP